MRLRIYILLAILAASTCILIDRTRERMKDDKRVVHTKWTTEEIQNVIVGVCKATGECDRVPNVRIEKNSSVNAYATSGEIVLFTGLLDKVRSLDEVALVVGHEMAHVLLGHVSGGQIISINDVRVAELEADKYGAFLMMRAGYSVCKGRIFMLDMMNTYGDVQDADHPDMAYRYSQLNVGCGEI